MASTKTIETTGNETLNLKQLLEVLSALKRGDLSRRMPVDNVGIAGKIADLLNDIIDQNDRMVKEFERIGNEVGQEGKISQRINSVSARGSWAACMNSVNFLIGNLVQPNTEVTRVISAVAGGDLSQNMSLAIDGKPLKGEFLRTAKIVNTMVDQLNSFASEVTRVAREVGTEGKLGGQADVRGVAGTWKDLTDSVNSMASNLTGQVRDIAEVTKAVATGDLSKKITVDVKGEILELKNTINTMVDQLNSLASEVTRVAREVGTEGKLGGQADVRGVAGTWKDLTDSVNSMAGNLTGQVRDIAEVTKAVARGDLSKKITVDVKGEILELKNTINTMVDQLNSFASEVTRVAREVGTEGKLGGQADVRGVAGTWKDLTDSVNSMASNLTGQVRNIAEVTTAVARGDLSKKITVDVKGEILALKDTINTMVDQLNSFASEVTRVAREVGTEGELGGQADVRGVAGTWKDLTDSVNFMASNLTGQVRNIAEVTTAVATGDLSKKITVDVKGEILELKDTINTMVDQLNSFASEVTRVAREVGTEGKLGGQADVRGVAGTWKDLTDSVNFMANNLTTQVRGIAEVVTSVANGDLKKKLYMEAKGEIAELSDTINDMIDTLGLFGDQVTTVAREVGIEGKLGGQASVPGAAGLWRDLTDNVNQLASNLTTQVRAIAEVATGVTKGDLSRSVTVKAAGEVAALSDNINEMIRNLRETTRINTEQDWLKTNLAKFTQLLQGQRNLVNVSKLILSELAPLVSVQHGAFFITETMESEYSLKLLASYAYQERKYVSNRFKPGEGLVGQCFLEKERILLTQVPADYIKVSSALGESSPLNIVVLPVLFEGEVKAIIELASFQSFTPIHLSFLDQLTESIGIVLNTIAASMRTEELLIQSQTLTEELQGRQQELTNTNARLEDQAKSLKASEDLLKEQREKLQEKNEELEEKARLLANQNDEVEQKNSEVEQARFSLEEKARQLALTSRYKSEFLANMSHELRTPLNNILILSKLLSDNESESLSTKQIEFARTIHASGNDLLQLINDILDLSKIESGKMSVDLDTVSFAELADYLERSFSETAKNRGLEFQVDLNSELPAGMITDLHKLQQILRNLLSNAFKFTPKGSVTLRIFPSKVGRKFSYVNAAETRIAFSVIDTGIGIPAEKQSVIFEAFRQADGSTSRKYGGTGLGLSISKEIAKLLGGELKLTSQIGIGSAFTLYLPVEYLPSDEGFNESDYLKPEDVWAIHGRVGAKDKKGISDGFSSAMTSSKSGSAGMPVLSEEKSPVETDSEILIFCDKESSASLLFESVSERGWKAIVCPDWESGRDLLHSPSICGIFLDLQSGELDNWIVLDALKQRAESRRIPVCVVSNRSDRWKGYRMGAFVQIAEPPDPTSIGEVLDKIRNYSTKKSKTVLFTGRNEVLEECGTTLESRGVTVKFADNLEEAIRTGRREDLDCLVVLSDLLDEESNSIRTIWESEIKPVPVILYKNGNADLEKRNLIRNLRGQTALVEVESGGQLDNALHVFLHLASPEPVESEGLEISNRKDKIKDVLENHKVLIVDDDVRNIFALTSMLEQSKMRIVYAESAKNGIDILQRMNDVEIVLMDVMMPDMDGYEAIRTIRSLPTFRDLPIFALTAKAMKGDREKCMEAGATYYVTKPVDVNGLLSLLRVCFT
ncbi:response regulator [Leptospira fluminis]|uniref:histidine kinase n=1 Tax=Leptospira fluminis TaxID=2484979 RepID=A0A4R9GQE6_9LEPT|nr:HAMP domain-containing protein [Leptospira fluminis]TGK19318.1 response regulator [Leptospira fluminis]